MVGQDHVWSWNYYHNHAASADKHDNCGRYHDLRLEGQMEHWYQYKQDDIFGCDFEVHKHNTARNCGDWKIVKR